MPNIAELTYDIAPYSAFLIYFPDQNLIKGIPSTVSISATVGRKNCYLAMRYSKIAYLCKEKSKGSFFRASEDTVPKELIYSATIHFKSKNGYSTMNELFAVYNQTKEEFRLCNGVKETNLFAIDCSCYAAYSRNSSVEYLVKKDHEHYWEGPIPEKELVNIPSAFAAYVEAVKPVLFSKSSEN